MNTITTTNPTIVSRDVGNFDELSAILQDYVAKNIFVATGVLFRVGFKNKHTLFENYLKIFEEGEVRQNYNCNCCKSFLHRYGGLVTIHPDTGVTTSVIWDETIVPEFYKENVKALRLLVEGANVREVFYRPRNISMLGLSESGGFQHFTIPAKHIKDAPSEFESVSSSISLSIENYKILSKHLAKFTPDALETANVLFESSAELKGYTTHAKNIAWVNSLKTKLSKMNGIHFKNLIWYEVATQSQGRLKFANTVGGEFVTSLQEGKPVNEVIRAFKAMVRPDVYMRPTALPTEGNIAAGERIIKELGLASALKRRYLRFDELPSFVWVPPVQAVTEVTEDVGVFSHLKAKDTISKLADNLGVINGETITWERFEKEILPKADKLHTTFSNAPYNITTYVTAADPEAKPIIAWDKEDNRNPISNYAYSQGSFPREWNLLIGKPIEVIGISIPGEDFTKEEKSGTRYLILKEAKETRISGLALFPEILRNELHSVRATIESYSQKGIIEGIDDSVGAIVLYANSPSINIQLVVTVGKFQTKYTIDRMR